MFGGIDVMTLPPFILDAFPLIKGFILNQKTQLITEDKEFGRGGIMTAANGITAHGL
jgi:hypothetical protein